MEKVFIDGEVYFDRDKDIAERAQIEAKKKGLIEKQREDEKRNAPQMQQRRPTTMNKTILLTLAMAGLAAAGQDDSFLLRGATIHPVSGPNIENAMLLVVDGKIAEIGLKIQTKLKVRIVEAKGMHVYPGFIDSGSPVGLQEVSSVRETGDTGELGMFNPQLKAISAVNPESEHIPVIRGNGTTLVQILPGVASGQGQTGIIGGQTSLVHLNGYTWEEMQTAGYVALEAEWPLPARAGRGGADFGGQRGSREGGGFAQANRVKEENIQKLTEFVEQARRYQTAKKAGAVPVDRKFEAMLPILDRTKPMVVTAARERAIREAVEWAEKQKIRIIVAGVTKPGKMVEELAKRKIPVILGSPYDVRMEEDDPYDDPYTLPARLHQAGVEFAYASFGLQFARNLPIDAGQAVAYGLPYEVALKAITMTPAKIWGVADKYGSIETGKMADLIVTDGDPLEPRSSVKMMFIHGAAVELESKHTRLNKKYMERP